MTAQNATVRFVGAGTLRASAGLARQASSALQGAGSLSALGVVYKSGNVALTGAGRLQATVSFVGLGAFAMLSGRGALTADPLIQYYLTNPATLAGAGKVCVNGVVHLGSPFGAMSNTVVTGPGPTNNAVA